MDMLWAGTRYWTIAVRDNIDGYAGLRLYRQVKGIESIAAEIIYWDAMGQFFAQTFGEVPLDILETLLAEAKQAVPTS
jgi:hypothetical protein